MSWNLQNFLYTLGVIFKGIDNRSSELLPGLGFFDYQNIAIENLRKYNIPFHVVLLDIFDFKGLKIKPSENTPKFIKGYCCINNIDFVKFNFSFRKEEKEKIKDLLAKLYEEGYLAKKYHFLFKERRKS